MPSKTTKPAAAEVRLATAQKRALHEQEKQIPAPFLWMFGATGLLMAFLLKPYAVPLFLAATLAVTAFPAHRAIERMLGKRRPTSAAALSTLCLFAMVIAPLVMLSAYSASAIAEGVSWVKENVSQQHLQELGEGKVPGPIRPAFARALSSLHITPEDVEGYADKVTSFLQVLTPKVASASIAFVSSLLFVLVAFFFFIKEGPQLSKHLFGALPLKREHTARLFDDFVSVASASMIGVLFTAVGQALALALGFWAAGLPHVFFLAVLTFVSAFVPLAGSALVWLPVSLAAGLYIGTKTAVALAIWSVIGVQIVDVGLKPLVLKGRMTMHGALVFLGMIGGLSLFGPVGFIAGPMLIAFFLSFLSMYERDYQSDVPT